MAPVVPRLPFRAMAVRLGGHNEPLLHAPFSLLFTPVVSPTHLCCSSTFCIYIFLWEDISHQLHIFAIEKKRQITFGGIDL